MRRYWYVLAALVVAAVQGPGPAQVGANAGSAYEVTPAVGPWMILATSYTGPQARFLAVKLVEELRTRYKLPAYLFDFVNEERQKEKERIDKLRKQQQQYLEQMNLEPATPIRIRTRRFEDQYAVLVGGYKSEEAAKTELARVKTLKAAPPPRETPGTPIDPRQVAWGPGDGNPFAQAFIVPNPTVKREPPPDQNKPDPLLKKLNAGETYNLLKCPKRYTLAVAQFRTAATTTLQPQPTPKTTLLQKLGLGGPSGYESLSASAMSAHNLAEMLHTKLNFEAYVMHTRYASVVTVGSFDQPDDPGLEALRRRLGQLKLDPIPLLPQFLPMDINQYR
jgi:hypothetical protein